MTMYAIQKNNVERTIILELYGMVCSSLLIIDWPLSSIRDEIIFVLILQQFQKKLFVSSAWFHLHNFYVADTVTELLLID